jgi:RimJ/RimL family protein N-acetyltransferase
VHNPAYATDRLNPSIGSSRTESTAAPDSSAGSAGTLLGAHQSAILVTDMAEITTIAERHIPSFREAVDVVAREGKFLAFLEAPALESTRAFVMNNIKQRHPQFVASDADRVVGWCDIIPNRSRHVHYHCGTLGIGLLPEYRGRGIGRALMQHTIAAAFAFGITRVELTVRKGNVNAIALYKHLGFAVEGLHRDAVCIDGRYEDLYSMALLKIFVDAHNSS